MYFRNGIGQDDWQDWVQTAAGTTVYASTYPFLQSGLELGVQAGLKASAPPEPPEPTVIEPDPEFTLYSTSAEEPEEPAPEPLAPSGQVTPAPPAPPPAPAPEPSSGLVMVPVLLGGALLAYFLLR